MTFRPGTPDQDLLLPPSLHEWLLADHLAYSIRELIDELGWGAFYALYEEDGQGKQPYELRMMLKVLIYAYATGTFSSRRIAAELEENVVYRALAAGNFPQHRAICAFCKRHLDGFKALFVKVVQLAGAIGLARLSTVAVDSTKVRANASKHKAMSYDRRLQKSEDCVKKWTDDLCATVHDQDAAKDARYGADWCGDEVPDELHRNQTRLKRTQQAKACLEAEQRASTDEPGRIADDGRHPPRGFYLKSAGQWSL